jgi:hypothetical protein
MMGKKMLRRSKKPLACCGCEDQSMPRRRTTVHCFLGRFLPKLRRCQKHRRFFWFLQGAYKWAELAAALPIKHRLGVLTEPDQRTMAVIVGSAGARD